MTPETRRTVVAALLELAAGTNFRDRADAGRALAVFADLPETHQPLVRLVIDAGDTYVTRVTAEALLRRRDAAGLAVVATALADTDDNHADWIHTAILDVFSIYADERDAAVRLCEELAGRPDDRLRRGAAHLIRSLTSFTPVLHPVTDPE